MDGRKRSGWKRPAGIEVTHGGAIAGAAEAGGACRTRDPERLKSKEIYREVEKLTANSLVPFSQPEKARKGVGHARWRERGSARSKLEQRGLYTTLDGNRSRWCAQASYRHTLRTSGVTNPVEIGNPGLRTQLGYGGEERKGEERSRLTDGAMLSVAERAGPCHPRLRGGGEARVWAVGGMGRALAEAAAALGWGFLFFSIFYFLFSKAFLNRILRATKIQPKAINTTIRYASACMHKQVCNSMLNFKFQ